MPDNVSNGELEDFIMEMISNDDKDWIKAQNYIDEILRENGKFSNRKITKAKVFAWLATRKFPGLIGKAIDAENLITDGLLCRRFTSWLAELFGEQSE